MAYVRKTIDEYEVLQHTPEGWECVTAAETYKEARQYLKDYRENQPEYDYKIIKKRVRKETIN